MHRRNENRVEICHECPLELLDMSRQWNDYDYALVHLFEKYPKYYQFFKSSLEMKRRVILDNSIFELGTAFDPDRFAEYIKELRPTEYIVPDVLENCDQTVSQFEDWLMHYPKVPGKRIGVIQGKTYQDIVHCYNYMSKYADKIAISFDYSYYDLTGLGQNKWQRFMSGRRALVSRLLEDNIWNLQKPHHLLGAALPQEFQYYWTEHGWNTLNIETLDTSNPVVHGVLDVWYSDNGLSEKKSIKMVELFEKSITPQQIKNIEFNVEIFKKLCGRLK